MWRVSGNLTKKFRICACQARNSLCEKHGVRCNFCSKPESAVAPGGPKPTSSPPPPPPPPASAPPPPPRKSGGAMKFIGGGLFVIAGFAAGTLAYAKANPDFRMQVESNWPILLDVFPYFFEDEPQKGTKKPVPATKEEPAPLGGLKKKNLQPITSPSPVLQPEATPVETPTKASPVTVSKPTSTSPTPPTKSEKAKSSISKPAPKASKDLEAALKKEEEDRKSKELQDRLIDQEIDEAANIAAYEAIIDSCVTSSVESTHDAVTAQKRAIDATRMHTDKLKKAMEDSQEVDSDLKKQQWEEVVVAAETKLEAVTEASRAESTAKENLAKLKSAIDEAKKIKSKFGSSPLLIGAQENYTQMTYDLQSSIAEVVKSQFEARVLQNYHELIEKGREEFKKELQSLMPEVKLGSKGKKLSEEELNSLIAHAHKRIYQLQRQLAEQQAMEQQRLAVALDNQRADDNEVTRSKINIELERQAADLAILYKKKEGDLRDEYEQEVRLQLRRQAGAHSDHLADVMKMQEHEFEKKLAMQEGAVRDQERDSYYQQLSGAMAKLKGVEAAIEGRAGLEKQNRKAQQLWLACETLKRTICTGKTEGATWEEKLKPLADEVYAIQEASEDNKFVYDIVQTIPEEALKRGVYNEDSLRQRWEQTQRVCRRVAMIDETGGSMFRYFLSAFQSLLVLSDTLPPNTDADVDPATLDTFKIISYASYHLERGDLEQALRYANQLTGMPRRVASDWLKEARLLLETTQAASVLSSHASAAGLGGLQFH